MNMLKNLLKERKICTKIVCFLHKIMMRLSQNYKVQKRNMTL